VVLLEGEQQKKISVIKSSMAEHFFTEEEKKKTDHPRGYRMPKDFASLLRCPKWGRWTSIAFMMIDQPF